MTRFSFFLVLLLFSHPVYAGEPHHGDEHEQGNDQTIIDPA